MMNDDVGYFFIWNTSTRKLASNAEYLQNTVFGPINSLSLSSSLHWYLVHDSLPHTPKFWGDFSVEGTAECLHHDDDM